METGGAARYVGAALVVWLLFLPAVLGVGMLLAWLAPAATDAAPTERSGVRAAAALLVVGFALLGLATIPEAVLRGMNLGYRRMGVQAAIVVAGAMVAAVHAVSGAKSHGAGGGGCADGCVLPRRREAERAVVRPRAPTRGPPAPRHERVAQVRRRRVKLLASDA